MSDYGQFNYAGREVSFNTGERLSFFMDDDHCWFEFEAWGETVGAVEMSFNDALQLIAQIEARISTRTKKPR